MSVTWPCLENNSRRSDCVVSSRRPRTYRDLLGAWGAGDPILVYFPTSASTLHTLSDTSSFNRDWQLEPRSRSTNQPINQPINQPLRLCLESFLLLLPVSHKHRCLDPSFGSLVVKFKCFRSFSFGLFPTGPIEISVNFSQFDQIPGHRIPILVRKYLLRQKRPHLSLGKVSDPSSEWVSEIRGRILVRNINLQSINSSVRVLGTQSLIMVSYNLIPLLVIGENGWILIQWLIHCLYTVGSPLLGIVNAVSIVSWWPLLTSCRSLWLLRCPRHL